MDEDSVPVPETPAPSPEATVTDGTGAAPVDAGVAPGPIDGAVGGLAATWPGLQEAADFIDAGGPVVVILFAMSALALGIVLAKAWQFAGAGLTDGRPVERALGHWRQGNAAAALDAARGGRGPAARALSAALAAGVGADDARAREAAWLAASDALEAARGWMRPLEVIASLAPLLGLFGTVLGMIAAFAELEAAGSRVDPSILSGGIWEALLTTAVGLAVAIPAVAAFNWFERRIERAGALAEHAVAALFSAEPATDEAPARRAGESRFRAAAGL